VQIAKDDDFSLRINEAEPPTNPYYQPPRTTNPAYRITAGTLPEVNATYYWEVRVRQAATGQIIRSQWSDERAFEIKAGLPVRSQYLGARALNPRKMPVVLDNKHSLLLDSFPRKRRIQVRAVQDSALKDIIFEITVPTTAYGYQGKLKYSSNYFWQVVATKPLPSEPSPVFSFTTEAAPTTPPVEPQLPYQIYHWFGAIFLSNILVDVIILATIILLLRSRQL